MDSPFQIANQPCLDPVAGPSPTTRQIVILPVEVIREIVDYVAYEGRTYAATLCLVSRVFHAWVCPILYRILRVDSAKINRWILGAPRGAAEPRRRFFKSTPSPPLTDQAILDQHGLDAEKLSKFGPFVKAILVQNKSVHIAVQILQSCVNVRDLSLWVLHGTTTPLQHVLNSLPHLERLSLDPSHILGRLHHPPHFELVQPFFRQLTHLELIHPSSAGLSQWNATQDLGTSRMPKLTHLALHVVEKHDLFPSLVQECPQLRAIVFLGTSITPEASRRTPKVVFLKKSIPGHDLLSGWEHAALVGGGFWDRANLALDTNTYGTPPTQSTDPLNAVGWPNSLDFDDDFGL